MPVNFSVTSQREALVGALCTGEQWADVVVKIEKMLSESVTVDDITAGLAVKAYAGMGLREYWEDVSHHCPPLTPPHLCRHDMNGVCRTSVLLEMRVPWRGRPASGSMSEDNEKNVS